MLLHRSGLVALGCAAWLAGGVGSAADWPQFHGLRRDNISTETGLLKQWPEEGPKLLWTARGIGEGFSTVAVAGGLIYTTGNIGDDTVITALDLDGKPRWQARNGPAFVRNRPGTRSTPTIDGGRLYHENADGDVVCLDAKTGKPVWQLNILQKFQGRNINWALAESPLIDGNNIICTPGGEEISLAALNKLTGETVWTCKGAGEKPGYASPILVEHQGLRQIVTLMARAAVGINADTGELLWKFEHVTPYDENIFTPLFHDGCIYFATGHAVGSRLLRLRVEGRKCSVELVWRSELLDSHHGGVVLHDGCLYGFCHGNYRPRWDCVEFKTGKAMHSVPANTTGSVTLADGMIYAMDERGNVMLVRPTPAEHVVVSRFSIPKGGRGPTWAHPVVCGGRLYIRHGDFLYAYDVRAAPRREKQEPMPDSVRGDDNIKVDCDFPGGNIVVEKIERDTVLLHQDLRDTAGDWFWWYFRARGPAGHTLTFRFTRGNPIGVRGPAVSADGGKTWRWLGRETVKDASFQYPITTTGEEVRFAFAPPYLEANLREFLKRHANNAALKVETLCRSKKGRNVERLRVGRLDGRCDHRVLLTARHHACESIASFTLEGIMDAVLDGGGDGNWFRHHVEFLAIPFMDKDGVEAGDQGKNRRPHDHNRDYAGESIYASVRALRAFVPEWSGGKLRVALDLHCPWIRGEHNEDLYFVGGPDPDNWARVGKFSEVLETVQTGPLVFSAKNNLPHGKAWNTSALSPSFSRWAAGLPGIRMATSMEIPYANAGGREVTAESAHAFGRDLARALRRFLEECDAR